MFGCLYNNAILLYCYGCAGAARKIDMWKQIEQESSETTSTSAGIYCIYMNLSLLYYNIRARVLSNLFTRLLPRRVL